MDRISKLFTMRAAFRTYVEMCNGLVEEEEKENHKECYYDEEDMEEERSHIVYKRIKNDDLEYLKYLDKYLNKIALFDKTNLESIRRDNRLYLALRK